jgi:S1-C subfamily serine protease
MHPLSIRKATVGWLAGVAAAVIAASWLVRQAPAEDLSPMVKDAETKRVAVIEKVKPSVVAIFAAGGNGGGSGVVIDEEGYALTNFHVVQGSGPIMKCGLPDGVLYDGVLAGLDKVGDVALIKLLPKKDGQKFPFAKMGDSDKLKAGDWSLAMGNPFLLATDFNPTVTFGLVSGVHRYQYPEGTLLEYTDCIQVDTSINPGNSGGPLFNMDGELVGINGRGSFEKRGRVNSGVGYAISINQIKNFMGHLRAGLETDHASLGATVQMATEEGSRTSLVVNNILDAHDCDVRRRGLDLQDALLDFAGRPVGSVNEFKNAMGLYPKGWRVPITYRHENERKEVLARLMGVQRQEIKNPDDKPPPPPGPKPPPAPKEVAKFYVTKPGFANYYFNEKERERLLGEFRKHGDFSSLIGPWEFTAGGTINDRNSTLQVGIADVKSDSGKDVTPLVKFKLGGVDITLEPLKKDLDVNELREPPSSGGLMLALYQYRLLLTLGTKGFVGDFSHGGVEPFYIPGPDAAKREYAKERVMAEVLRTEGGGVSAKWYFSTGDHSMLGFEVTADKEDDPCEIYLSDYKKVDGRDLPHKIEVWYGNKRYANLIIPADGFKLSAAK